MSKMPGYTSYSQIRGVRYTKVCKRCGGVDIYQEPDTDIRHECEAQDEESEQEEV